MRRNCGQRAGRFFNSTRVITYCICASRRTARAPAHYACVPRVKLRLFHSLEGKGEVFRV
ncbi:MAG: hypothetical protein DBX55_01300 [Verrucomicrobia bacterium]|nr:MAG: hypothetical protein DBX55_01300 [Verrucomicrobiota bacterium]